MGRRRDLDIDTVIADMEKAVVRGEFYPLIPINPVTGLAIQEVLELVARIPVTAGTPCGDGDDFDGKSTQTAHV